MIRYDFYETFKIKDSEVQNLSFHLERIEKTLNHFKAPIEVDGLLLEEWSRTHLRDLSNTVMDGRLRIDFLFVEGSVQTAWQTSIIKDYTSPQRLRLAYCSERDEEWNYKLCKNILKNDFIDCDDTIFINSNSLVCETTRANIFLLINDEFVTPPLKCGVLAGTTRAHLLKQKKIEIEGTTYPIKETIITSDQLLMGHKIFLCNSLMGLLPAEIIGSKHETFSLESDT